MSIMKSKRCLNYFKNPTVLHITTVYMEKKHLSFGISEHNSVRYIRVIHGHLNLLENRNIVLGTGE
jgi:hypothetical protein